MIHRAFEPGWMQGSPHNYFYGYNCFVCPKMKKLIGNLLNWKTKDDSEVIPHTEIVYSNVGMFGSMPDELYINIAKFLLLRDLYHLAQSHPRLTNLLFNQQLSKLKFIPKPHEKVLTKRNLPENFKSEEGPEFELVQQLI